MIKENFVIVYWNETQESPVFHFINENVNDIKEFADSVVPDGVYYNIVLENEIHQRAVPNKTNKFLKNNIYNLYNEYLNAL